MNSGLVLSTCSSFFTAGILRPGDSGRCQAGEPGRAIGPGTTAGVASLDLPPVSAPSSTSCSRCQPPSLRYSGASASRPPPRAPASSFLDSSAARSARAFVASSERPSSSPALVLFNRAPRVEPRTRSSAGPGADKDRLLGLQPTLPAVAHGVDPELSQPAGAVRSRVSLETVPGVA